MHYFDLHKVYLSCKIHIPCDRGSGHWAEQIWPYIEKEINLRKSSLCIHVFDGTAIKTDILSSARQ